jgi:predicted nuclease of predicted toxin-antitoxin system
MKILLDESLPRKLKNDFGINHEVWTVRDKGWLSKKNGELLKLMINDGFELFVTADQNLQYQQKVERLPLTIAVLRGSDNRLSTLQNLVPLLFKRINEGSLPNVIEISAD